MKIKKLGIEWGAAFQEAQPIEITHGDSGPIQVYVAEGHTLSVVLPHGFCIVPQRDGTIRIDLEE